VSIEVTASDAPITVSASGTKIDATVSGAQGPQGPQGKQGEPGKSGAADWAEISGKPSDFPPSAHSHTIADVTGLSEDLDGKVSLAGGTMNVGAALDFSNGTTDSEVGGWGFGVELTADTNTFAKVETAGFTVQSSNAAAAVTVSGITNSGDGYISGIMGWGDPSGTKWSDLNGTYVRTSVAVRPSVYTDGNQGMHTPASGTYNYYLSNPISMGSPNAAWNGIAYFLAPGNRSGWGDANNDGQTDPPVNYWRLCVLDDWPFTYFTNPSSDPYTFPTTGWVPVSASAPTPNEGAGYNGADYLGNYGGGFSVATSGGSSTLSSSALTITSGDGSTVVSVSGLTLPNATHVRVGSFDNSTGGQGGISLVCAVGNELNWQGGRLRNVQVGGDGSPQPITSDSSIIFPGDGVSDMEIGAAGLTFSDGSAQTVAWTGSMSYNDLDDLPTLFDGSYNSLSDVPASFEPSSHKTSHEVGGSDEITADNLLVSCEFASTAEEHYESLGQALAGLDDAIVGKQAAGSYATLEEGTIPLAQIPSSGVDAGEYTKVTVDAYGRVTNGSAHEVSSIKTANGDTFYAYTTDGQLTWSTTPPAPSGTPASLLLHFDGDFTDSSANGLTVTAEGASIDTTTKKYGAGSALIPSTEHDYCEIADDGLLLLNADYTLEFWINFLTINSDSSVFISTDNNTYFAVNVDPSDIAVYLNSGSAEMTFAHGFALNEWHHFALVRSGEAVTAYIDGVVVGTATSSGNHGYSSATYTRIGNPGPGVLGFNIDDLRIVKGLAVYTGPFTPPTAPLTAIATPYA